MQKRVRRENGLIHLQIQLLQILQNIQTLPTHNAEEYE